MEHKGTTIGFSVYHDLIIDAQLEKVFAAVSQPDHLVKWWPLRCTGDVALGGEFNFYFAPEYD